MGEIVFKTLQVDFNFIVRAILTNGKISKPYNPSKVVFPPIPIDVKFLWDTGATNTVITKELANRLGIKSVGKIITHGIGGEHLADQYIINVELPNGVIFPFITVTEGIFKDFDVLIGMDIIKYGDFSITNFEEKTKFSFRVPSIKENEK